MSEKSKEKYEMKKLVKRLKKIRGSGTELISLYIPAKYPISEVSNKLRDEYGQAGNIKSKATRKNVQSALEKIINYLKLFREVPKNGLAVFCGNIAEEEGAQKIELFSVEPFEPINIQFYRCDSVFALEPLEELLTTKDVYGLVVMDGKDASIGILKGKQTKIIRKLHSTAHSKHIKGGQSARRFQRLIEESIEKYYVRIGEAMDEVFLPVENLKGIILGGPGPAKDAFLKLKPFNYQLKILGCVDIGYCDEQGIWELVEKSKEIISEQEVIKEKGLVSYFIKEVVSDGLAVYGEREVREALDLNKVDTLLISEELEWKRVKLRCSNCGKEEEKVTKEVKEEECGCGGKLRVIEERDVSEELLQLAEEKGVKIELIASETNEGSQFLHGFKGIGALLRYK